MDYRQTFVRPLAALSLGLALATPAAAYNDCTVGATLDVAYGVPTACNTACTYTGGEWLCDTTVLSANAWQANMITDTGRTVCGYDYCAWGTDGANTFCCAMDDDAALDHATLSGGTQPDTLSLAWNDGAVPYDLTEIGGGLNLVGAVFGQAGNDVLYGSRSAAGSYQDHVSGGGHDDTCYGQGGNDVILGGLGYDTIYGGPGDDQINAGEQDDYVDAGLGADTVCGGPGIDTLLGGSGIDFLWDLDAGDTLDGGPPAGGDTCGDSAGGAAFVGCTVFVTVGPACPS